MTQTSPVVVVTGVGPGTGAAIAQHFSIGGYKVAMLARTRERLATMERELPNTKGYPCDVTDESQLDRTIDAICQDLGTPRTFMHNAVGGAFGNFMEIDPQGQRAGFEGSAPSIENSLSATGLC